MNIKDNFPYPSFRPRRLRKGELIRNFVSDVRLDPKDFVMPVFVRTGEKATKVISSMPGISQMSPDLAVNYVDSLVNQGITNFIFFGIVEKSCKDATGSIALDDTNPVNVTMRALKEKGTKALLVADLCCCEYTDHGHCGPLSSDAEETVDNDRAIELIAKQAAVLAKNGADIVAPSCMFDGMVKAVRYTLDFEGFKNTCIMSYSTKFASSFYGPFREAAEGAPQFGNRKSYQMDFRRKREWEIETILDIEEGADMLMIKPATLYLDIINQVSQMTTLPVGAYHVSGEYSLLHAGAEKGFLDLKSAALESLYAIKRAGADFIISYFAKDLPNWL